MVELRPPGRDLFRTHVAWGAEKLPGEGHPRLLEHAGQSEVQQLDPPVAAQHEIRRFDIPMDHALLVRIVERIGRVGHPPGNGVEVLAVRAALTHTGRRKPERRARGVRGRADAGAKRQRRIARPDPRHAAEIGDDLVQPPTLDKLHGIVAGAAFLALGIDGDNIGVVELARRLGFPAKSHDRRSRQPESRRQYFERHRAVQRDLPGLIDDAHAARTDPPLNAKVSKLRARGQ